MKYLIVILVIVVAAWMLTRSRRTGRSAAEKGSAGATPLAMVQCKYCGVHLPRAEVVVGDHGTFCSEEHRLAGPRAS